MKTKKAGKILYEGLGFPIELYNVEMLYIDGDWHPKIDIKKVADDAIKALACQKERLTGNQIKFIRTYFSMSLRDFSNIVNESHTAISKWEKKGNKVASMDINIEKMLKLYLIEKVCVKTAKQKMAFFDKYLELRELSPKDNNQTHTIQIHAS